MVDKAPSGGSESGRESGRIWREIRRRVEELSMDASSELTAEELEDLFYRRAREMSYVPDHDRETADRLKVVTFRLGSDRYAMSIDMVREIQRDESITPLPMAPDFVVGVMNLRGNILSVVDIRVFFGLPGITRGDKTRILVVEGEGLRIGVMVEGVDEIIDIGNQDIKPPLSLDKGINEDYILGIVPEGGKMVVLIDMKKILRNPRLVVEENV